MIASNGMGSSKLEAFLFFSRIMAFRDQAVLNYIVAEPFMLWTESMLAAMTKRLNDLIWRTFEKYK